MGGFCENVNINYIAGRSQFVKTSCQSAISLTSERRERERDLIRVQKTYIIIMMMKHKSVQLNKDYNNWPAGDRCSDSDRNRYEYLCRRLFWRTVHTVKRRLRLPLVLLLLLLQLHAETRQAAKWLSGNVAKWPRGRWLAKRRSQQQSELCA